MSPNLRTPVLLFAGIFVATLVLTGCEAPSDTPARPDAATPPVADAGLRWEGLASDEGAALVLLGQGDRQVFHMACLSSDREMQIIASDFTVIGSEERMTMGIENEAYGFVADTEWTGGGVMARGSIDATLLGALSRTTEVSVLYGIQQGGPWPAPSADQRDTFIQVCTAISQQSGGGTAA